MHISECITDRIFPHRLQVYPQTGMNVHKLIDDPKLVRQCGGMTNMLDLRQHTWLHSEALRHLYDAIAAAGGEARVVGGAVRDALLGRAVGDIDLATNLPPEKVTAALKAAGIKTVPTGLDHGTLTAVMDHKGYEITTLRRDMETDGRRAKVIFTDNWREDALRRDFTFNALYVDAQGTIYDYGDGQKDLAAGRVRFIGKASERIKEDVLRILRFFRFNAWFGQGAPDAEGLTACRELASLLPQLSVERVWREIIKLLAAPNPAPTWQLMLDHFILPQLIPEADRLDRLQALINVEARYEMSPSALVRFASLLPSSVEAARQVSQHLKLSNREADKLRVLAVLPALLHGKLDPIPLRHVLYTYGTEDVRDAALLFAAENSGVDLDPALTLIADWQKPTFPLQGSDLLKLGFAPGPQMGVVLRALEDWWIARDFRPTRTECLDEATKHSTPT